MADVFDRATRSRVMASIRGRDTKPELIVRRHLHRCGLRFRLHTRSLPGSPDLVFPRHRAVVFVHGCFWHQHRGCRFAVLPKGNREFWSAKLSANRQRDRSNAARLRRTGWRVFTLWECKLSPAMLDQLAHAIRLPFR